MADIKKAIQWLREGKKIRRPMWNYGAYLVLGDDEIFNDNRDLVKFSNINSLEATDWEIVKEDFCLEEKIRFPSYDKIGYCSESDVKQCFKLIKDDLEKVEGRDRRIELTYAKKIIDRRAGEKLT